jgi:hypothetical protein
MAHDRLEHAKQIEIDPPDSQDAPFVAARNNQVIRAGTLPSDQ